MSLPKYFLWCPIPENSLGRGGGHSYTGLFFTVLKKKFPFDYIHVPTTEDYIRVIMIIIIIIIVIIIHPHSL